MSNDYQIAHGTFVAWFFSFCNLTEIRERHIKKRNQNLYPIYSV